MAFQKLWIYTTLCAQVGYKPFGDLYYIQSSFPLISNHAIILSDIYEEIRTSLNNVWILCLSPLQKHQLHHPSQALLFSQGFPKGSCSI